MFPYIAQIRDSIITMEMMRHPGITSYDKDVYEIKLSDGSRIKATSNHKLKLKDNNYNEVSNYKLMIIYGQSSKEKILEKKIDIRKI